MRSTGASFFSRRVPWREVTSPYLTADNAVGAVVRETRAIRKPRPPELTSILFRSCREVHRLPLKPVATRETWRPNIGNYRRRFEKEHVVNSDIEQPNENLMARSSEGVFAQVDATANRVYLVVPFLNEAKSLPDILRSIATQNMAPELLFLVAVDSGSTDSGPQIVRDFLARGPIEGIVLRSEIRSIPGALNTGFRWVADRGIVIRLDAHTLYDPEYVPTIVQEFANQPDSVWCVGGAQTPEASKQFGRALVVAFMTNPIGLGFSPHRFASKPQIVKDVYLGAFRAGVIEKVGYFDERWRANEDSEVMARIFKAGGQVLWLPLKSAYRVNRGPIATLRQWARYGFWRAQTIKRHPHTLGIRHLIPPTALTLGAVLAASPRRVWLIPLVALYGVAIVVLRPREEHPLVTAASTLYFPAAHSLNALGLITGFLTPLRSKSS
jgi:succinoglycan biosynthesis protein ExoA